MREIQLSTFRHPKQEASLFLELQCLSKLLWGLFKETFLDALAFATDVTRVLPKNKQNKLGRRRECFFPPSKFVITSVVTIIRLKPDCTVHCRIIFLKKSLKIMLGASVKESIKFSAILSRSESLHFPTSGVWTKKSR